MEKEMKLKFLVDIALVFALLLTAFTGIITALTGAKIGFWIAAHVIFALTTVGLVLFHLFLHKEWISIAYKKFFEKK